MEVKGKQFSIARMSGRYLAITVVAFIFGIAWPIVIAFVAPKHLAEDVAFIVAGVIWGIIAFFFLFFRPIHFAIVPKGLRIVWPLRWRFIPIDRIIRAEIISYKGLGHMKSQIGLDGFMGIFGRFTSKKFGELIITASNRDILVLVTLEKGRSLVITPNNRDEFVDLLNYFVIHGGKGFVIQAEHKQELA